MPLSQSVTSQSSQSKKRHGRRSPPRFKQGEPTDFSRWIEKMGIPVRTLSEQIGVHPKTVYWWATGLRIPDLVCAYRIEVITKGMVTPVSFLNTRCAKAVWNALVANSEAPPDAWSR